MTLKPWLSLLLVACGHHDEKLPAPAPPEPPAGARLDVTSTAFAPNAQIPSEHTCEGADTAPPLAWSGAPPATKSFAIVVDDPDAPDPKAPQQTWVHMVLVRLPPTVTSLAARPPPSAQYGKNDFGKTEWGGPCPPIGRHRYFFKVYALDAMVGQGGITKDALEKQMAGHILASGELVGTYQKKPE